jgi:hypothetical protein
LAGKINKKDILMKIVKLSILVLAIVGMTGCHHWHKHPHHGGDFCPPGQAKKGNC